MNKMYNVKNRSASMVIYKIPEMGIRRELIPGRTIQVSFDELQKLTFTPGGNEMLAQFLQVQEVEAVEALGIHAEPEYNMSEQQIIELLEHGSLDAFLDCLDFAPTGVIDLVKRFAVTVPLTDYQKRKALKQKTGFDVDAAIKNLEAEKAEEAPDTTTNTTGRRTQVKPAEEVVTPGRRTSGSKYKVLNTSSTEE